MKKPLYDDSWFDIWFADKNNMITTMLNNIRSDLDAGYNYFGNSLTKQRREVEQYKEELDKQMDLFRTMDEDKVEHWCYYDLKKRGVIS